MNSTYLIVALLALWAGDVVASRVPPGVKTFTVTATVMTTETGGRVLASGARNSANWERFVALPCPTAHGRLVGVYVPKTGQVARRVPVRDVGPWCVDDAYWVKNRRPLAESGISDVKVRGKDGKLRAKYPRGATNDAGIDLSLKLCRSLGLQYPFTGQVVWWFEGEAEDA